MEDSTQFNIRISRALIDDMDFIARRLKISRAEWFKARLAEMIHDEKQKAMDELTWAYITNQLSEQDYRDETGSFPTAGMRKLKARSKAAAARYLRQAAATTPSPPVRVSCSSCGASFALMEDVAMDNRPAHPQPGRGSMNENKAK